MPTFRIRTFAGLAVALGLTATQIPAYAGQAPTTTTTLVKTKPTTTTTLKPTTTTTLKATTTTTTKPSTTTTTLPPTTTTTQPPTTTTTAPPTTTTTQPPTTSTTQPPSTTTTTTSPTTTTSGPTTTTTLPPEICGNCLDDDGDGAVDFDDSDCCAIKTSIVLKRYSVRPRRDDDTTYTKVRSCLPLPDKSLINPFVQDLHVQLRDESGTFFCAVINHEKFMRLHSRAIAFWDRSETKNPMARGIQDVAFTKSKCTGFYLFGPHMQYLAEQHDGYTMTIGLQNPFVTENNVCASTQSGLQSGKPLLSGHNKR